MKKITAFLLAAALFLLPAIDCFAEEEVSITAPAYCLMEKDSRKVLLEKNSHEKRSCASITKVMTLILTLEAIEEGRLSLDDTLSASAHASSMGGSDIWLKEGETMTVDDLLKATVIMSANDAAVVLAEAVSGSEEAFVNEMNNKAAALGMADTTFKNCNGLDEEGHLTSAYDVALMSCELLNYELIYNYTNVWIDYLRNGDTQLVNTNKLIKSYRGITGLKTGTTSLAGSCISATAEREGLHLVSVILGADTTEHRFKDAAALLNYGFANYCIVTPEVTLPDKVEVVNSMVPNVSLRFEGGRGMLAAIKDKNSVTAEFRLKDELRAPIAKGDIVGSVIYKIKDEVLCELPVFADSDAEEISFTSVLKRIMKLLFASSKTKQHAVT